MLKDVAVQGDDSHQAERPSLAHIILSEAAVHPGMVPTLGTLTLVTSPRFPVCLGRSPDPGDSTLSNPPVTEPRLCRAAKSGSSACLVFLTRRRGPVVLKCVSLQTSENTAAK